MSGTQSLEEKREQAKSAFLATLAAARRNPNGKEIVEELTRMLGGIEGLGAGGMTADDLAQGFAAVPELKDEHGNSIVEISEAPNDVTVPTPTGETITNAPVKHLWEMPAQAAAARKAELDKMWDDLEKEEEAWMRRQEKKDTKAADAAKGEIKKKQPTAFPPSKATPSNLPLSSSTTSPAPASPTRKSKSVKFADGSAPKNPTGTVDWGDVVPATLKSRRTPVSRATPVMKFEVVERGPRGAPAHVDADSDDEDEGNAGSNADDTDEETREYGMREPPSDDDDDDEVDAPQDEEYDDDDDNLNEMQRQAASDYYAKRDSIFREAEQSGLGSAPTQSTSSKVPESTWEQELVPLDATFNGTAPSTSSKFKATRTGTPSVIVTAIGPDAREVIKEGKLVDGKLVVPPDSESDDDGLGEVGRKMVELLRKRDDGDGGDVLPSSSQTLPQPPTSDIAGTQKSAAPSTVLGKIVERAPKSMNSQFKPKFPMAPRPQPAQTAPSQSSSRNPMIIDSPSFPQASSQPSFAALPPTMVREMKEGSTARGNAKATGTPPRVSRFRAERM